MNSALLARLDLSSAPNVLGWLEGSAFARVLQKM